MSIYACGLSVALVRVMHHNKLLSIGVFVIVLYKTSPPSSPRVQ